MARRHVYDRMMDENSSDIVSFREASYQRYKESKTSMGTTKSVREVMAKNYDDDQRLLLKIHRIWRITNWSAIVLIANYAFARFLKFLRIPKTFEMGVGFLMISLAFAGVVVVFAEGTDHDKFRTRSGWICMAVSEAIIMSPLGWDMGLTGIFGIVNSVTEKIGGAIFNIENYQYSDLGWLWLLSLFLAVVISVSLLLENQSTDKRLAFARTPSKKDITDWGRAVDDDGNPVIRQKKYKK